MKTNPPPPDEIPNVFIYEREHGARTYVNALSKLVDEMGVCVRVHECTSIE